VYAPPDKIEQVDYALNISVRILSRYEELFGVPYMLPKLGTPPMNYIFRRLIKSVYTANHKIRDILFLTITLANLNLSFIVFISF